MDSVYPPLGAKVGTRKNIDEWFDREENGTAPSVDLTPFHRIDSLEKLCRVPEIECILKSHGEK